MIDAWVQVEIFIVAVLLGGWRSGPPSLPSLVIAMLAGAIWLWPLRSWVTLRGFVSD
jgi:hypothetical protein